MIRKRLSREDRREETTLRLLEAGQKVIAKKGLAATSVEDIAAAAGYTRGAFYSNFKSKSDLFIELLRRDHERANAEFFALLDDELPLDRIQEGMREAYGRLYKDNECFMNWTEARLLSARDPRFRAKLNAFMAEKRDQIVKFIEYFYKRAGASPGVPSASLAMGFMSLVEGVRLFAASSPADMTPEVAETVLKTFIDAIMTMGRAGTP